MEPESEAIRRLEGQLEEERDRHLRLAAEYDNYRKRVARERSRAGRPGPGGAGGPAARRAGRHGAARAPTARPRRSSRPPGGRAGRQEASEGAGGGRAGAASIRSGATFDPSLHEAVSSCRRRRQSQDHQVSATFQAGLPLQGRARAPRAGAGVLRAGTGLTWPRRTSTRSWASPTRPSQAEIKKAYRRLAKQHHPDANPNNAAGRRALQGDLGGAQRPLRRRQAEAVRSDAPAGRVRRRRRARSAPARGRRASGGGARSGLSDARAWSSATSAGWATSSRRSSGAAAARRSRRTRGARDRGRGAVPGGGPWRQGAGHARR